MSEPAIQSINQHTQKNTLNWLDNFLVQPSTGAGSGVAPATHEQFGLSLDLLRQALVEVTNVVNNLTTTVPGKVLDARQGKVLADTIQAEIAKYAQPNGIATLGSDGKVPASQIPSLALVDVFTVESEAAMLALDAEQGDMAIRTDSNQVFVLSASPASTLANWVELSALKALVDSALDAIKGDGWDGQTLVGLDTKIDTNRLYSDQQYIELKAKADSLQVKCNTLQAEVYTDDPILQYGAVEIIGDGYEADDTPIDVSANVVDGKLSMEQKGLTISNLVNGASIANLGTVTFASILNDKYYDTLNNAILTGTGSNMTATNNSGATANMAIYHLNAHGLDHITDTDILAKMLPYVDGTKAVGKMGLRVVGVNLFDKSKVLMNMRLSASSGIPYSLEKSVCSDFIKVTEGTYTFSRNELGSDVGTGYVWTYDAKRNPVRYVSYINGSLSDRQFVIQEGEAYLRFNLFGMTEFVLLDNVHIQLELGSTATAYEPYQEQLTFLPAIGNSLPNGVADSIKTVADGWEHSKRVYTPEAVGSGVAVNTTNYPTAKNAGQWVNELTAGGTEIGVVGTDSTTGAGMLRFELATPITTHYDLTIPTSGKTIHRFAGEEKIALYGTWVNFSENVLSVLSANKFVAGVMTDITSLATITGATVTFSGVSATDVVYVMVEHDVDRPLGILEHTPAVSNTASRLASLEARVSALEV